MLNSTITLKYYLPNGETETFTATQMSDKYHWEPPQIGQIVQFNQYKYKVVSVKEKNNDYEVELKSAGQSLLTSS